MFVSHARLHHQTNHSPSLRLLLPSSQTRPPVSSSHHPSSTPNHQLPTHRTTPAHPPPTSPNPSKNPTPPPSPSPPHLHPPLIKNIPRSSIAKKPPLHLSRFPVLGHIPSAHPAASKKNSVSESWKSLLVNSHVGACYPDVVRPTTSRCRNPSAGGRACLAGGETEVCVAAVY